MLLIKKKKKRRSAGFSWLATKHRRSKIHYVARLASRSELKLKKKKKSIKILYPPACIHLVCVFFFIFIYLLIFPNFCKVFRLIVSVVGHEC